MSRAVAVALCSSISIFWGAAAFAADDDDEIIILEEGDLETTNTLEAPEVTGALGRLWETWHFAADSEVAGSIQLVDPSDGPLRLWAGLWLESWLLPTPNLSFYANGFARLAVDGSPDANIVPWADVYEAFAKINVDHAVVNLGRIVVPWGRTQAAALGDRLNPPDLRRGRPFPDPARQKQPMWGASIRGSVGSLGVEGIYFARRENTEGSLAASNQGGLRIARYQTALVRSPHSVSGLLQPDDTSALRETPAFFATSSLAARIGRRIGDVDLGGSVVYGYDETPTLKLDREVALALSSEWTPAHPSTTSDIASLCPGGRINLACIGDSESLSFHRNVSLSVDASLGLGIVILRAEAIATPKTSVGGKSALIVDDRGLSSIGVSQYAAALAVEGSVGDAVEGSLEFFDVLWTDIPAHAWLWGVEPATADVSSNRAVHRVASAVNLGGSFYDERVSWRVRGEAGFAGPDLLASAELRYRLPFFGMYAGGRADVYTGVEGTPGWFRQQATAIGLFVGEGG